MTTKITIVGITSFCTFLCAYFLKLSMDNFEQYIAVAAVIWLDGIFGIWAGCKREGFKTFKAIKITRTTAIWLVILTVILMIEKGFTGTGWLSEVVVVPFMILQLISALKNASMAGLIKTNELNKILDRIDKHKGLRS
jgi:phage-related holin|tara:strand:- start:603 stop:1016 length:414 start_codon:yes stop_codon:yes gene_type:complete